MAWRKYWNEKIETMPREELRELQFKRLKKQLNHVYRNSAYYGGLMREAGITPEDVQSLDDFTRFPVTYKDSIR